MCVCVYAVLLIRLIISLCVFLFDCLFVCADWLPAHLFDFDLGLFWLVVRVFVGLIDRLCVYCSSVWLCVFDCLIGLLLVCLCLSV